MTLVEKMPNASLRLWLCAALLLCAAPAFAQQQLNAAQIRALFAGNTLSGENELGYDVQVYMDPSGKMSGQSNNRYTDVGTWYVTDDGRYCRKWNNWRDGAEDCFTIRQAGPTSVRIKAISRPYDGVYRVIRGDPHDLKDSL